MILAISINSRFPASNYLGDSCVSEGSVFSYVENGLHQLRIKTRAWIEAVATFPHHVLRVVFLRPKEKMVRVEALAVVAVMEDTKVRLGIKSHPQDCRNAVDAPTLSLDSYLSVSRLPARQCPVPAFGVVYQAVVQQPLFDLIFRRPCHKTVTSVVYANPRGRSKAVTIFRPGPEV